MESRQGGREHEREGEREGESEGGREREKVVLFYGPSGQSESH